MSSKPIASSLALLLAVALMMSVSLVAASAAGGSWSLIRNEWGEGSQAINSGAVLDGKLFVGLSSNISGAQVWSFDGSGWTWLNEAGFGGPGTRDGSQAQPMVMTVYDNKLYVGVSCDLAATDGIESYTGSQIWRYDGGTSWTKVNTDGFGNKYNLNVTCMGVYNSKLYVGVSFHQPTSPTSSNDKYQLLRYDGGTTWTPVLDIPIQQEIAYPNSMTVYDSKLYVAIAQFMTGVVIKSYDGTTWQDVSTPGFGYRYTSSGPSMAVFDSGSGPKLYVGTGTEVLEDQYKKGCQVWRYEGGQSWTQVSKDGFGVRDNKSATSMLVDGSTLYAGTWNQVSGCEMWSYNGTTWTQVNSGGFGNPNQNSVVGALAVYNSELYAGAYQNIQPTTSSGNNSGGQGRACQVWRMTAPPQPVRISATDSIGVTEPAQKWYLAEGATAGGFETWILVQNPESEAAQVTLTYQTDMGEVNGPTINLAPESRESINVADTVQTYNVSTVVSSNKPVVAERAVYFNDRNCATDSIGTTTPATTWYLAEGATAGGFETWVLVQNPESEAAQVILTYQTDKGEVAGPTLNLAPKSRQSVNVSDTVQTYNVSTVVSSNKPVVAERAVYVDNRRKDGTDSIGVTEPALKWYLAEGATAGGFETWVLVQNPGSDEAQVTLTYQTDVGEKTGPTFNLAPKSRESINVADTVQTYKVSTLVTSDKPVVAERAVYFNDRKCATDSIGVTEPALKWYLAEGATAGGFETWVLVQNPGSEAAQVTLTYQTDVGKVNGPTINLAPESRESINVADTVQTYKVSTLVTSDKPVVAERAMYFSR